MKQVLTAFYQKNLEQIRQDYKRLKVKERTFLWF